MKEKQNVVPGIPEHFAVLLDQQMIRSLQPTIWLVMMSNRTSFWLDISCDRLPWQLFHPTDRDI